MFNQTGLGFNQLFGIATEKYIWGKPKKGGIDQKVSSSKFFTLRAS